MNIIEWEREKAETIRVLHNIRDVPNAQRPRGETPLEYVKSEAVALLDILEGHTNETPH